MAPTQSFDAMMKHPKSEMQKGMEAWEEWMKSHKTSFVDPGAPVAKNKRVSGQGVKDARNEVGGYMVVQTESHEEAAELFADNPHLAMMPGAWIEIMAMVDMPGM